MKKNLILFAILAASINLNAATSSTLLEEIIFKTTNLANVKFSVKVTYSGNPLAGASVNVLQEGKSIASAITDIKGTVTINIANYNGKLVSITTSLMGYQNNTMKGTALSNGKSINISLTKGTGSAAAAESKVESIYSKSEEKVNKIEKKTEHHITDTEKANEKTEKLNQQAKKTEDDVVSANEKTEAIRKKAEEAKKKLNKNEKMQITYVMKQPKSVPMQKKKFQTLLMIGQRPLKKELD